MLRLALAYAVSDLSLKDVAAWAHAMGVAEITGPGLFYRLQEAEGWLQRVLAQTLQSEVESGAGSSLRAGGGCDGHSWPWGEGYGRYRVSAQEVILGDRAYATARGLGAVHAAHAYVVARLNPHTIRVCDEQRKRLALRDKEKEVPQIRGFYFSWSDLT